MARGMAENPDHFFQHREASNPYYDAVPAIVEEYMEKISEITGRKYGLFNYYGDPEADRVIIAMGSVTQAAQEAIDYLMEKVRRSVLWLSICIVRSLQSISLQPFLRRRSVSQCLTVPRNRVQLASLCILM